MKIAIIPARSGSTRIKDKNIYNLNGKPILSYPLEAAINSKLFDKIHVSTDSEKYAEISNNMGVIVDFLRDKKLSENKSSLMDTLRSVIDEYEKRGESYDEICMIYATAVLIDSEDLIDGYKQFNKFGGYTPTIAVSEFPAPIERALCKTDTGTLAWHEPENRFLHSQECITAYYDAAAFIYFNVKQIYEDKQAVLEEYVPYILPKWKVTDINTYDDLMVAKYLQLGRSLEN